MAQEQTPQLVKNDGQRTPAGGFISREELLEIVKAVVGANANTEAMVARVASEVASQAVQGALNVADKPELRKGDWNVHNFPNKSDFNRAGEKDHPRDDVVGEVWWNGQFLRKDDHNVEECILINQLRPGLFHGGQWRVIDLAPGVPGTRKLLVVFPCKDPDARGALPSMLDMLRELTGQTATVAA